MSRRANDRNARTLWSRDYMFLIVSSFFLFFGDFLLMPALPVHIEKNGGGNFQIGVATAAFFATSILMRVFTSRASARLGRKPLLTGALLLFALAMAGYYFSASFSMILGLRLVQGAGFGAATTLLGSMAADIIPRERMGEGMGYFGFGIAVAMALGPFLGASAATSADPRWLFLAAALLETVTILLALCIQDSPRPSPPETRVQPRGFLSEFIEPVVFYPALFLLLIGLSTGGFSTYVVLFGNKTRISNISVYFLVTSVAEFLVRIFSGKMYDRRGMAFVVAPGAVAGVLSCIAMAEAKSLVLVSVSAVLGGIAFGMVFPAVEASAMKDAGPERRVAANATLYNFLDIGCGLGPLLFGAVVQFSGYPDAYYLSSLAFAGMLVLLVTARSAPTALRP